MGRNPRPRTIRETSDRKGAAFVPPPNGWTATTSALLWRFPWLRRDRAKAGKPAPTSVTPSTRHKVVLTAGMLPSFFEGCHDFVARNTENVRLPPTLPPPTRAPKPSFRSFETSPKFLAAHNFDRHPGPAGLTRWQLSIR